MIRPLGDRVVIEVAEAETKTASGIILADTAKEKPMKGVVVAVGPGEFKDGQRSPMDVKAGWHYPGISGYSFCFDGRQ